jgi:hypothetical protein
MRATSVWYKRLFNTGNFTNEEIGIEIEVEEGEKASEVLKKAIQFVDACDKNKPYLKKYQESLEIVAHRELHNYARVIEAERFVKMYEMQEQFGDDLPF